MGQCHCGQLQGSEGFYDLCQKAHRGKTEEVLAAVDQCRNQNLATRSGVNGTTLLIWVCEGSRDNPQLALGLLERRADVLARNKNNGKDALMGASQNGHLAVCTLLLERGANVHARDYERRDSLIWAAQNGHVAVVALLLKRGADVHTLDYESRDALMSAARNGHVAVCALLLEKGANVYTRNRDSCDALMIASSMGHVAVCALLLEKGANVCTRNKFGMDALTIASYNGHIEVCLLLISLRVNQIMLVAGSRISLVSLDRKTLEIFGGHRRLTPEKTRQGRATLRGAFDIERRWASRWPVMNVMVGCGFRPLAARLRELEVQRVLLSARGELPPTTILGTSERRRTYFMGQVFGNDGLLRLIVLFS